MHTPHRGSMAEQDLEDERGWDGMGGLPCCGLTSAPTEVGAGFLSQKLE